MAKTEKHEKIPDLLPRIKDCLDRGAFVFTKHALERREQRSLLLPDILHVLRNGWHERKKDAWNEHYNEWDYAVRGKTKDQDDVRIVVCFEEQQNLLIITVIRLDR